MARIRTIKPEERKRIAEFILESLGEGIHAAAGAEAKANVKLLWPDAFKPKQEVLA